MNSLRTKLARHALGYGTQPEFRRGQVHEARATAKRSGRTGQQNRARPVLNHRSCGCAADQESGQTTYAPATLELVRLGLEDAASDERPGVEDRHSQLTVLLGRVEETLHVGGFRSLAVTRRRAGL